MNCSICKQPVGAERNYCGGCGTALARFCVRCGFRNQFADRFCGGCGAPLDAGGALASASDLLSQPAASFPSPPEAPGAADDLAELLIAAREGAEPKPDDPSARVSQDDIDSLFGD